MPRFAHVDKGEAEPGRGILSHSNTKFTRSQALAGITRSQAPLGNALLSRLCLANASGLSYFDCPIVASSDLCFG